MKAEKPDVQIILPVYDEADCIESVIREIHDELSPRLSVEFIICADAAGDKTKEILDTLGRQMAMRVDSSETRRGYSNAIIDGFRIATAEYILVLDADGQCSPKDFWKFYEQREKSPVLIGWRNPRIDPFLRRAASGMFKALYKILFPLPLHDPSCPFILINNEVVKSLLHELGCLKQGFWWEFNARAFHKGFTITEIPVTHRARRAGKTKVYQIGRLPGIAVSHLKGLFRIWREARR